MAGNPLPRRPRQPGRRGVKKRVAPVLRGYLKQADQERPAIIRKFLVKLFSKCLGKHRLFGKRRHQKTFIFIYQ
ncbi:hypothetical protein F1542_02495 [Komagataeibacter sp. FXV3]|nr:hypothetical protein [Komagataeibacter sp. FXV3]